MEQFEVKWEADDGYVGGSAPHYLHIQADELDEAMDDEQLKDLFWEAIQSDFEQKVSPFSGDEERFIEWAREQIKTMTEETI